MDSELIDARTGVDYGNVAVTPQVLGEGGFGCVLKSADGKWAIKVQETPVTVAGASEMCEYESGVQGRLAKAVQNAAVAQVYSYVSDARFIPPAWRNTLMSGCAKARAWAARNWEGHFCITIMDFLPGKAPHALDAQNLPAFCFALLYTVTQGYKKLRFQHLDIKTANIILIPQSKGKETYRVCSRGAEWTFSGITAIPRLVDFGLATVTGMPASINPLKNMGATLMITPFEVVVGRIMPSGGAPRSFMHIVRGKRYHWGYDLFSIGLTILQAAMATRPDDYIGMRMIIDVTSIIDQTLTRYGIPPRSPAGEHPSMILMYMFNLCILQQLLGNGRYPWPTENPAWDAFYPPGTVGYDLLRTPHGKQMVDYVVSRNVSLYSGDIAKFTRTHGKEALGLVQWLMRWNPDERGGSLKKRADSTILMHPFFERYKKTIRCDVGAVVAPKGGDDKRARTHVQTLYHQTSPEAARAIIESQTFRLGKQGLAGGGIYFAASVTDTDRKAETKGVILEAEVTLGRTKTITQPVPTMTLERLRAEGYDSVYIMTNSGPEYVVYNPSQVRNARYALGDDVLNRELTIVYPGLQVAKILMLAIGGGPSGYLVWLGRDTRTQQYRLFGGTHDRKRSRGDNARHEWCEEFGAFLRGPDILCNPPTFEELKNAPKIFQNGKVGKGGPPKTNIIILMDVGDENVDVFQWNKNNQAVRAKPTTPSDYKEIDKLMEMELSELIKVANATPPGKAASKGKEYTISSETLQAVRDLHAAKMFGRKK